MKARLVATILGLFCASSWLGAQTPAAAPPARGTERPEPEDVAKLKGGPALPFKANASWAQLPNGYNFGECTGVDVDKQGNVWVLNRGHWPLMQFDRNGKMLKAISVDTSTSPTPTAFASRRMEISGVWIATARCFSRSARKAAF